MQKSNHLKISSHTGYIAVLFAINLSSAFCQQSSSYNTNGVIGFSGTSNTGFGFGVMAGFFSGAPGNTGIGNNALYNNNGGEFNTALGNSALEFNNLGSANTAAGFSALRYNSSSGAGGSNNTATGNRALYSNDAGNNNTATGYEALYSNTSGANNTADGFRALYYNLGVAGDFGERNSAFGFASMYANYNGDENTGLGIGTLYTNSDGIRNTAVGAYSMLFPFNPTGIMNQDNSAVGYGALCGYYTTTGNSKNNSAAGYYSLFSCSSGYDNSAVGHYSQYNLYDGYENVSIGIDASKQMQGGSQNVSCGAYAGRDYVGIFGTGGKNTAIGGGALLFNLGGEENVGIGHMALGSINGTGNFNTAVGYYADMTGGHQNSTAFGNLSLVTGSNKMRIGNNTISNIDCAVNYTGISDGRFKYNIKDNTVVGLKFINALRPTVYDVDLKKLEEFQIKNLPEDVKKIHMNQNFNTSSSQRNSGFIAQEVETAAKNCGYDFDGVLKPQNATDNYNLMYGLFVVPLTKAVQEQQALIELQTIQNNQLEEKTILAAEKIAVLKKELLPKVQNQPTTFNDGNILVQLPLGTKNGHASLYDLSGAEIENIQLPENCTSVNLGKQQPGIYLYSIYANGSLISSNTIVIK